MDCKKFLHSIRIDKNCIPFAIYFLTASLICGLIKSNVFMVRQYWKTTRRFQDLLCLSVPRFLWTFWNIYKVWVPAFNIQLFLFCQSFKNRMKLLETTKFITWYVHTSCCKFVNYWNVVKLKFRPIFTFYKYIVHTMYLNFKCFMGFPILKVPQINYVSRNQFHNMYIKWLSNFGLSWPG